ncbi:hypothetical protein GCK72_017468 [Caenorhabditis remanei]|uniref:Phlebovirus glycoprotein G2 fusion domain-containing protein n=1 Tax=Caenorhabditis remanei TaxID=31234 RepID=A0A6A5G7D8_CAERE|nr:hypothetical protein GCK72_017468 [Caenorhabditis remanei]KAF1750917.1 hypothetical protein GCK72_017468 [Caenorhabditis remanei]
MLGIFAIHLVFDPFASCIQLKIFFGCVQKNPSTGCAQLKVIKCTCTVTPTGIEKDFDKSEMQYSEQHSTYLLSLHFNNFKEETLRIVNDVNKFSILFIAGYNA